MLALSSSTFRANFRKGQIQADLLAKNTTQSGPGGLGLWPRGWLFDIEMQKREKLGLNWWVKFLYHPYYPSLLEAYEKMPVGPDASSKPLHFRQRALST